MDNQNCFRKFSKNNEKYTYVLIPVTNDSHNAKKKQNKSRRTIVESISYREIDKFTATMKALSILISAILYHETVSEVCKKVSA